MAFAQGFVAALQTLRTIVCQNNVEGKGAARMTRSCVHSMVVSVDG